MSAPYRKAEVAAIAARYPQAFGHGDPARRLLLPVLARGLNAIEGSAQWWLLNRLDREDDDPRPGRLAADILVWGPTKEHFDVLTDTGPMWASRGIVTNPRWHLEDPNAWPSWDDNMPLPAPPAPDDPLPDTILVRRVGLVEATVLAHAEQLREVRGAIAGATSLFERLLSRVELLENRPVPAFTLPELVAEGTTSRAFGHGHTVQLRVRPR